ncbi:hypothetical protein GRF59_20540 [Paenibacillus sp. HJL G12]|uniref:Uncharacterized protein n=1 Tax=Paenibacillus dendrobii TaxID=2691084 RepID=A0A7X3LHN4_9BACL|nr:hypothetical protein [Paenibacillus dendrobii]MWV46011.1 hypothetical protein [Paenibacillus dendrobii]
MEFKKRFEPLSGLALLTGLLCFLFVFVIPLHIPPESFPYSGFVLVLLTVVSFSIALAGLIRRPEKTWMLRIALVLSLSLPIFWLLVVLWLIGAAFGLIR